MQTRFTGALNDNGGACALRERLPESPQYLGTPEP